MNQSTQQQLLDSLLGANGNDQSTGGSLINMQDFMPDFGQMIWDVVGPYLPFLIAIAALIVIAWLVSFFSKLRMQKAVVDLRKEVREINLKLNQLSQLNPPTPTNSQPTPTQPPEPGRDRYVANQ